MSLRLLIILHLVYFADFLRNSNTCMTWDIVGDNLSLMCRVNNFLHPLLLLDNTRKEYTKCRFTGQDIHCTSADNGVSASFNQPQKEVDFIIPIINHMNIDGTWFCLQGKNELKTHVSKSKGIIDGTDVNLFGKCFITHNDSRVELQCSTCRQPRGYNVEFLVDGRSEDSVIYDPRTGNCSHQGMLCKPDKCSCGSYGKEFNITLYLSVITNTNGTMFSCDVQFADKDRSSIFSKRAHVFFIENEFYTMNVTTKMIKPPTTDSIHGDIVSTKNKTVIDDIGSRLENSTSPSNVLKCNGNNPLSITVIFIMTLLAVLVLVLGAAVVFLVHGHRRKSNKRMTIENEEEKSPLLEMNVKDKNEQKENSLQEMTVTNDNEEEEVSLQDTTVKDENEQKEDSLQEMTVTNESGEEEVSLQNTTVTIENQHEEVILHKTIVKDQNEQKEDSLQEMTVTVENETEDIRLQETTVKDENDQKEDSLQEMAETNKNEQEEVSLQETTVTNEHDQEEVILQETIGDESFFQAQNPLQLNGPFVARIIAPKQLDLQQILPHIKILNIFKIGEKLVLTGHSEDKYKLIVMNIHGNTQFSLPLHSSKIPWKLTEIDQRGIDMIALAYVQSNVIDIINVSKGKLETKIEIPDKCRALSPYGSSLCVIVYKHILLVDHKGNIIKDTRLPSDDVDYMFVHKEQIIYTYIETLYCCDFEGELLWKLKPEGIRFVSDLAVDGCGNSYVSGSSPYRVLVISADGSQQKTLLFEDTLVSIRFDSKTNCLLVFPSKDASIVRLYDVHVRSFQ